MKRSFSVVHKDGWLTQPGMALHRIQLYANMYIYLHTYIYIFTYKHILYVYTKNILKNVHGKQESYE